ncbi:MAG TPA: DUF6519 domain-containing protein [Verrucomicrobiae bacterium]
MSGDYTKFTFRARKDYSGVLKQQGRVDLDADFNELIEIIDRRWRSETIDIIGHCTVPQVAPGTPPELDPFLIIPTAMGAFNIGIGRMYVDGIQVENHGLPRVNPPPPEDYLADLGELRGGLPIPYNDQPYLPQPLPPVLNATPGTSDLVYIDVWQREVTVLEEPSLREIALGGPDTTTRVQSVWQVRALQDIGQHGCGDVIQRWNDLVAPSAGRLTTSAVAPPSSDDPCIISPSGGYRGLENRLYRVEIHSPGTVGGGAPAKFKWSRNNATIASSVSGIPDANHIVVQQIGRDRVLRFEIGNWIEITDDFREFGDDGSGRVGLAGHMARITAIDEANRVLAFAPPIPAAINFDATDPSRHTRVRRWDQTRKVDADGLLDVTAGPIDIEDGIRVEFTLDPSATRGNFKVGDYWVFAARTADGSVEPLVKAPPRGILHHYCRLGFIHWRAPIRNTTFDDCRKHWPPVCCEAGCTVTVGDGVDSHGQFTDIQQAINALGNRGGVVCIGRGVYTVQQTIRLQGLRNIIIRGTGPATRILFAASQGNQRFMEIGGCEHISIEQMFIASLDAQVLIELTRSHFCTIKSCTLVNLNFQDPAGAAEGGTQNGRAVSLAGLCTGCVIKENLILAPKGVVSTGRQVRALEIRDNRLLTRLVAIYIQEAAGLEIVHNHLAGLNQEKLKKLLSENQLTRDNLDRFQQEVSRAFAAAVSQTDLQVAGIILIVARNATIRDNWIVAQLGVLGYLVLDGRITDNQCFAFIGVFTIFGVLVQVSDNLILGLWVSILHAGIVVDFRYEGNTFLGLYGIELLSLAELARILSPLLGLAMVNGGFTGNGAGMMASTYGTARAEAGSLESIGLAAVLKAHRNVFLTFVNGIQKSARIISGDFAILENTFLLCANVGIELGAGHSEGLSAFSQVINPRHLIQSNAFNVSGKGIVSECDFTQIFDNNIFCGITAIELNASACTIQSNFLRAWQPEAPIVTGLILLKSGATQLCIIANELFGGPAHGILFAENVTGARLEKNLIRSFRLNGISTVAAETVTNRLAVCGNQITRCRGGSWHAGAVVLGTGRDVKVSGNSIIANDSGGEESLNCYGLYADTLAGAEINGNTLANNDAGIALSALHGDVRLQGNCLRNKTDFALRILRCDGPLLIQNNVMTGGSDRRNRWVNVVSEDSLQLQANHFTSQAPAPCLVLSAKFAIVDGNIVRQTSGGANSVLLHGPGWWSGGRAIITSNLTTGAISHSGFSLMAIDHNLILP